MADDVSGSSVPTELKEKLADFDNSLSDIEQIIQPWLNVPESEIHEKLSPLDKAKLDLVGAYTINSLFWMYLNVCGEKPKEHAVKQELDRIRSYMTRVRSVQDKLTVMPHVDKGAVKRFQRAALWQAAKGIQTTDATGGANSTAGSSKDVPGPSTRNVSNNPHRKRKADIDEGNDDDSEPVKRKKKKKNKNKKQKH